MKNNHKGFSLLELVVVIGILSFVIALIFIPQLELQKALQDNHKRAGRSLQLTEVKNKIISEENVLGASSLVTPTNEALCPCIQGGAFLKPDKTPVCKETVCKSTRDQEFVFYDPKDSSVEIAGTATHPVYYNMEGRPCPVTESSQQECAYQLLSKYEAHCPGGLATCDHADYVVLTLELVPTTSGSQSIAGEKVQMVHTVPLNYPPLIGVIPAQSLVRPEVKKIAVNVSPGDPTENQKFIFEKCQSSNEEVVIAKCYRIDYGVGQMILTSVSAGTAQITLQINDGASNNNLSEEMLIDVEVTEPPPPPPPT